MTVVTYAAASTGLPADARKDYARVLRYAAGPGQKQGTAPGELPLGYAPMPAKLKAQAAAAADRLERGTPTGPGATTGGTAGGDGGATGGPNSGGGQGTNGTTGSTGTGSGGSGSGSASGSGSGSASGSTGGGTDTGAAAGSPSSAAPPPASGAGGNGSGGAPGERLADTGSTPSQVLGVIRWVLLAVLVVGGVAGIAGPAVLAAAGRRRIPSDSPRTGIRNLKSG